MLYSLLVEVESPIISEVTKSVLGEPLETPATLKPNIRTSQPPK